MPRTKRIDLRLLSYFHTVARTGNITHAAEILNIAQPTLSKALQQLESQLGAQLLVRQSYGITLTDIGERLRRHAGAVMAQVRDAEEEVGQLLTGEAGTVCIGAGPSWVRRKLPEAVAFATTQRPDLRVDVIAGFDDRLLERLTAGDLDFVVAERPLPDDHSNLIFDRLTSDHLVVVARKAHPLAGKTSIPVDAVLGMSWALPAPGTLARRKLDGRLTSLGYAPPIAAVSSSSLTFLMMFSARSDALLYTTRSLLSSPEGAGLVELDVPDLITSREAGLVFREPGLLPPASLFMADILKRICHEDPFN